MTRQPRCGFDVGSLRVSKPVSQGLQPGTGARRVDGDGGPGWPIGLAAHCGAGMYTEMGLWAEADILGHSAMQTS